MQQQIDTTTRAIAESVLLHTRAALEYSQVKELIEAIESPLYKNDCNDFTVEFDGEEFRVIHDSAIWDIYKEGIKEITLDCYLRESTLPDFLAVDWEETARNCYVDGYGHHFASYDGEETEHRNWWIFRTN
jgi:hypothetical protein